MKKIFGVLVFIIVSLLLSACGSKEKDKIIEDLRSQVQELQEENEDLQARLDSMTIMEVSPETSLREVETSDVPVFEKIDGKIVFPNKLELPDSADDVNDSFIRVGSRFTLVPSNNWQMVLTGTNLELSHPMKIWGRVKAVAVKEPVPEKDMQGLLQKFFKGFPSTTVSYRKLFMDERVTGMLASADIKVDNKPYNLNVGFVTRGENGLLFLFTYEITDKGVQQELIDLLLGTVRYGDVYLKLQ